MNSLPPIHPNCQCYIEDGNWKLGESVSGPCPLCEMLQEQYNSSQQVKLPKILETDK
jgi:hypothetical protein